MDATESKQKDGATLEKWSGSPGGEEGIRWPRLKKFLSWGMPASDCHRDNSYTTELKTT
jgi:hypothetical protein